MIKGTHRYNYGNQRSFLSPVATCNPGVNREKRQISQRLNEVFSDTLSRESLIYESATIYCTINFSVSAEKELIQCNTMPSLDAFTSFVKSETIL